VGRQRYQGRWQQYLALMPVFGLIPAVVGLLRQRSDRQTKDTSRVAIALLLSWLTSVAMVDGAPLGDVPDGLTKGTLGAVYVVVCIWLMIRVFRGLPVELPWDLGDR
jgi:hypothetical protein